MDLTRAFNALATACQNVGIAAKVLERNLAMYGESLPLFDIEEYPIEDLGNYNTDCAYTDCRKHGIYLDLSMIREQRWDIVERAMKTMEDGFDNKKFLGAEKYLPVLKHIYDGLGIPEMQQEPPDDYFGNYPY